MKVAIATDEGEVAGHFGRCPSYVIADIADGQILAKEEIPNPGHEPGFLPQYLAERQVECIIAGGMGPRAKGLFDEKEIKVITGVNGGVDDVLQKFAVGSLESGEDSCGHLGSCDH